MIPSFPQLLIGLAFINVLTFLLYWYDKYCARNAMWRVPEGVLLAFGLAGGTVGGFLAQRIFRHKTRKTSFQIRFWLIALLQAVAIIYFFATQP